MCLVPQAHDKLLSVLFPQSVSGSDLYGAARCDVECVLLVKHCSGILCSEDSYFQCSVLQGRSGKLDLRVSVKKCRRFHDKQQ